MKILQINKFFYLRGGAERHYVDVCDLLEEKGHDVIHFSMKDKRNFDSPYKKYFVSNVSFDSISPRTLIGAGRVVYSFEARRKLTKLLRDTKPDVAHIHLMYHHLSPSILLALRDANVPVVMTIHDWQALCPNYHLFANGHVCTACRKKSYAHVFFDRGIKHSYIMSGLAAGAGWWHHRNRWYEDLIHRYIAPSRFARELFLSYGWNDEQLVHIPHFLNHPVAAQRSVEKRPYVLYAGRLSEEKGIDRLVELWGKSNLPYELKIAGRGPLEGKLKSLIAHYKLENRVSLLGFVELENLRPLMQHAAGVVAPSVVFETFGLSILEAFGEGTGVLASDMGALRELTRESEGGITFSWDSENPAHAIYEYMEHRHLWDRYGARGQAYARQFTRDRFYDSLLSVYASLLHK